MNEPCEFLPWDSEFFGKRIAHVIGNRLTPARARAVLHWADTNHIDCVYFLADPADAPTFRVAAEHDFDLVDIRITLAADTPAIARVETPLRIRQATAGDIGRLRDIAAVSHRDSRFYADGRFDRSRCDELFATWIERSCSGYADIVLVADVDGRVSGYMTGRLVRGSGGQIGLVAVAADARGRGCGTAIGSALADWFARQGAARITVVTQARNSQALRFYQRCGFALADIAVWYHRWSKSVREDAVLPDRPANCA